MAETSEKLERYKRHVAKWTGKAILRFRYAKKQVPADAQAVCIYDEDRTRGKGLWWYVTPAFSYDPGAWRISVWDERGPIGHVVDDVFGKPLMELRHAVYEVITNHPRARVVEYVSEDGEHVRVGPGVPCG